MNYNTIEYNPVSRIIYPNNLSITCNTLSCSVITASVVHGTASYASFAVSASDTKTLNNANASIGTDGDVYTKGTINIWDTANSDYKTFSTADSQVVLNSNLQIGALGQPSLTIIATDASNDAIYVNGGQFVIDNSGSITACPSITSSLRGTASFAISASYAPGVGGITPGGSYDISASWASSSLSSSYASSASHLIPSLNTVSVGGMEINGGQIIMSDPMYIGNDGADVFKIVTETAGTYYIGEVDAFQGFHGNLKGTASWATNALTASYAGTSISSSWASSSLSSSYFSGSQLTASSILVGEILPLGSSIGSAATPFTTIYATNFYGTASHAISASLAHNANNVIYDAALTNNSIVLGENVTPSSWSLSVYPDDGYFNIVNNSNGLKAFTIDKLTNNATIGNWQGAALNTSKLWVDGNISCSVVTASRINASQRIDVGPNIQIINNGGTDTWFNANTYRIANLTWYGATVGGYCTRVNGHGFFGGSNSSFGWRATTDGFGANLPDTFLKRLDLGVVQVSSSLVAKEYISASRLEINGNISCSVITASGYIGGCAVKTANYTLGLSDYTVIFSGSTTGLTASLPGTTTNSGRIYNIKNTGNTTVYISGSNLIDGASNLQLSTLWQSTILQSCGTFWNIL